MASFLFLLQYRDTKAIFYLFYKINKVFTSFRDVTHVSVLKYKMKMTSVVSLYSERKCGSSYHSVRRTRVVL